MYFLNKNCIFSQYFGFEVLHQCQDYMPKMHVICPSFCTSLYIRVEPISTCYVAAEAVES
jgi:hypothetical protein